MSDFSENLIFGISEADTENILSSYVGPPPPANLLMEGVLYKMFLTRDGNDNPMLKVLYKTVGGDYDEYVAWDNISIIPTAAFKWKALLDDVLHVSVEDLNSRTKVDFENETAAGHPVLSIGKVKLTGDLPVTFAVTYRRYTDENGNKSRQPKVHMVWSGHE